MQSIKDARTVAHPAAVLERESPELAYKKRVLVQILSDWHLPYSSDEEAGWPLNAHVFSSWGSGDLARSKRIVYKTVESRRRFHVLSVFFQRDTFGYSDLDFLARKARLYPGSESDRTYDAIQLALEDLAFAFSSTPLFCTFPDAAPVTSRREAAEERYARLAGAFDVKLEDLQKTIKRATTRAYTETADEEGVSVPTVKRAVKWRNEHHNLGQKHRTPKAKGNLRRRHAARADK